uniref:5-formyltetrahydrofolate cyclo-ligase n=1 Tax=uncultured Parolsenella sp. TaxID=2083008 RepID=UPI0025D964C2
MPATPDNKQILRTQLKAMRRGLGPSLRASVDAALARRVLGLPQWEAAPIVLAYLSVREEVDTRALVASALAAGKRVA